MNDKSDIKIESNVEIVSGNKSITVSESVVKNESEDKMSNVDESIDKNDNKNGNESAVKSESEDESKHEEVKDNESVASNVVSKNEVRNESVDEVRVVQVSVQDEVEEMVELVPRAVGNDRGIGLGLIRQVFVSETDTMSLDGVSDSGMGGESSGSPLRFEASNASVINILSDLEFVNSYNLTDTT